MGLAGMLDMPVIMMSGHATIDTAVEATRIGAMDFLESRSRCSACSDRRRRPGARRAAPAPVAAHPAIASAAMALEDELDPPPLTTASAGEVPVTSNGQLGSISLDQPCARRATSSSASISNTTWSGKATA